MSGTAVAAIISGAIGVASIVGPAIKRRKEERDVAGKQRKLERGQQGLLNRDERFSRKMHQRQMSRDKSMFEHQKGLTKKNLLMAEEDVERTGKQQKQAQKRSLLSGAKRKASVNQQRSLLGKRKH